MFRNFNFLADYFGTEFEKYFFNTNTRKVGFKFDETDETELPTGDVKITTGENENGTWEKKEWISSDGSTKMSSYSFTSKESKSTSDVKLLREKIKTAVNAEDYETAARLKKEVETLTSKWETENR